MSLGSIAAICGAYYVAAVTFRQKRFLDGLLLRIPVVGGCLRSFAIARFSWAFSLTQQTGMPMSRSLELSLRATGNGAFMGASPAVCSQVMQGDELGEALDATGLFPEEYLHIVHVAETSGTVPEALERLSPQFEEQARRSLQALASVVGWLVWVAVAGLIIFIIFSVFLTYFAKINDLSKGIL
jgi:type IV pilus assembly protein PilC